MPNATALCQLQGKTVAPFKKATTLDIAGLESKTEHLISSSSHNDLEKVVLKNHFYNAQLWSLEDKARDPAAEDAEIAAIKRSIDKVNQLRNDAMEEINQYLLEKEFPHLSNSAPLATEAPASALDRLSILNLKIFHMSALVEKGQREDLAAKVSILEDQKADLTSALNQLFNDLKANQRQFKQYHQMKMYNTPGLNPYLKDNAE